MKHHSKFISHKEIREYLAKRLKNHLGEDLISVQEVSIGGGLIFYKCSYKGGSYCYRKKFLIEEMRKKGMVE